MGGLFSDLNDVRMNEIDIGGYPDLENTIDCAIKLIERSKGKICVITGAGISAPQLPTFRSRDNSGLWDVLKAPDLSKSNFYENPLPSWRLAANVRNLQINNILKHTLAHNVLHQLIIDGIVSDLLTQNCDGLHSYGDKFDNKVIELHGSASDYGRCEKCDKLRKVDVLEILHQDKSPTCEVCGSVLRPLVAFFQDTIPKYIREGSERALNTCDLILVVGTYCAVDPVLSFVRNAKRNGTLLIEINPAESNASQFMDVSLRYTANDAFKIIAEHFYPDESFE